MRPRSNIEYLLEKAEKDTAFWDALTLIEEWYQEHGERTQFIEHAAQARLSDSLQCMCTGCAVEVVVLQWFLS